MIEDIITTSLRALRPDADIADVLAAKRVLEVALGGKAVGPGFSTFIQS